MEITVKIRQKTIFSLLYLFNYKTYKSFKEILRINKLSDKELQKYHEDKLKDLLIHSYQNVPYYTKVLKSAKVVDDDLNVNLDNFEKIPILTKEILRSEFENLKSKDLDSMKWEYNTSGGSSGEPARFIQDDNYKAWNIANKIFYKTTGGAQVGGKELRLWGSERDILEGSEDIKIVLRNKLYNRLELNMFKMHIEKFPEIIETWNKFKPEWVEGYVHVLIEFAKYIEKHNLKIYKTKGILATAGTLDWNSRKLLEKAFNTKIYNRYGSREVGDMAFGIESKEGLKISVWNHHIEVLDNKFKKTNKMGKVHITNLNNYAMPLIRYDIGDIATMGKKWNYLESVQGRITSIFKTRDGGFFDGCYFRTILNFKDWIKQFQIVQKDFELIEYKIVPRDKNFKFTNEEKNEITTNVQKLMGKQCKVTFKIVDKIDTLKSGKYLYTKSEI